MRALILGGGGALGAAVARHADARGIDTHIVLRAGSRDDRLAGHPGVHRHRLDLADVDALVATFRAVAPDWVAMAAFPSGHATDAPAHRRLLTGMGSQLLAVMEAIAASRWRGSLAWFGSAMAYGPADAVARVDEAPRPATFRGAVKAAESLLAARLAADRGIALTELRVFTAYGPFQQRERLVSRLLHAGLTGERVPLAATAYRRDWIHCDDVAAACVAAVLAPPSSPRIVNVCTGRTHDTHHVATVLERIVGRPLVAEQRPEMPEHYGHARVGETPSAASGFDWTPRFDLEAGLAQSWDWARTGAGRDYLRQDATAAA